MFARDDSLPDHGAPSSPPAAASSPPTNPFLSPSRSGRPKERRVPSVTPRRFRRFFTPRPPRPRAARLMLGTLDSAAVNHHMASPQSLAGEAPGGSDPAWPSSPTERLAGAHHAADARDQLEPPPKRRRGLTLSNVPRLLPGSRSLDALDDASDENAGPGVRPKPDLVGSGHARPAPSPSDPPQSHFFKASRRGVRHWSEKSQLAAELVSSADEDSSSVSFDASPGSRPRGPPPPKPTPLTSARCPSRSGTTSPSRSANFATAASRPTCSTASTASPRMPATTTPPILSVMPGPTRPPSTATASTPTTARPSTARAPASPSASRAATPPRSRPSATRRATSASCPRPSSRPPATR